MGDVVGRGEINVALMRFVSWGKKVKAWTTGLKQSGPSFSAQENELTKFSF